MFLQRLTVDSVVPRSEEGELFDVSSYVELENR